MRSYITLLVLVSSFLIIGCASNKNKNEADSSKPSLQIPATVGQILVALEIIEPLDTSTNQIKAKVSNVLAYGSSTSILPSESILTLFVPEDDSFSSLTNMKAGDIFEATIKQQRSGIDSKNLSGLWNIVELKK